MPKEVTILVRPRHDVSAMACNTIAYRCVAKTSYTMWASEFVFCTVIWSRARVLIYEEATA